MNSFSVFLCVILLIAVSSADVDANESFIVLTKMLRQKPLSLMYDLQVAAGVRQYGSDGGGDNGCRLFLDGCLAEPCRMTDKS
jgi:hypothetical protein